MDFAQVGIGFEAAKALAAQGATIVGVGRNPQKSEDAAAQITRTTGNPKVEFLVADLSVQAQVRQLAATFKQKYNRLDVLLNNAGGFFARREVSADAIEMTWALNHLNYFLLTDQLLDVLKASAPARIVNVSSGAAQTGGAIGAHYAASKAGLIHLTRRMAVKLIPDHVVVTAIAPGPFASDMNRAARDHADQVATRVPARRVGVDEDMAGAAIYLASRAGDYVVGATIVVDGGMVYANPGIKGSGWDS